MSRKERDVKPIFAISCVFLFRPTYFLEENITMNCNVQLSKTHVLVASFVLALGLTGCTHLDETESRIFITEFSGYLARPLSQSETLKLETLVDFEKTYVNPGDPNIDYGNHPDLFYSITSPTFKHSGYYFLKDGTPLMDSLSDNKKREIRKVIRSMIFRADNKSWKPAWEQETG